MENKRLEQETAGRTRPVQVDHARDYQKAQQRVEELQAISPAFRKITRNVVQPPPEQWREFSRELSQRLESDGVPYLQTLRDKLSSTDGNLLHWFWIIVALLVLAGLAVVLMVTAGEPAAAVAYGACELLYFSSLCG